MGTGVILTRRWVRPSGVGAVGVAGWQLSAGGLVLLIPTLVFEGVPESFDTAGALGYLWLGIVGGLLAYTLWFRGLGRLPVAAGLGVVFAGESLDLTQIAGFTLALAALFCGQLSPRSLVGPHARTTKGTTS